MLPSCYLLVNALSVIRPSIHRQLSNTPGQNFQTHQAKTSKNVHPSMRTPSVHPYIYLSIRAYIHAFNLLSDHPCVLPCVLPCVHPCVHPSIHQQRPNTRGQKELYSLLLFGCGVFGWPSLTSFGEPVDEVRRNGGMELLLILGVQDPCIFPVEYLGLKQGL